MARFCEVCPNKGNCVNEINSIRTISSFTEGTISDNGRTASISVVSGIPQGPTAITVQYRDVSGGASEPITLRGDSYEDAVKTAFNHIEDIEGCSEPTETKKFLGLLTTRSCSAD